MLTRKPQIFVGMSVEASVGLAAAWSGAVGAMLLAVILARLFS